MRLGDLDALFAEIENDYKNANGIRRRGLSEALDSIADAPTIDAVPVVRCKDCKHFHRPTNWPPEYTKGRCDVELWERRVHPDNFCAYGERKDGDGNG